MKHFDKYTNTIIDKMDPFPTKQELLERAKVVLVVDDNTNVDLVNFNQKQVVVSEVERLIKEAKTVDVLDRGIIKNIKEEAILSQLKSGVSIAGNSEADYIFLIKMESLLFNSEYDDRIPTKLAFSAAKIGMMGAMAVATKGRGVYLDVGSSSVSGEYNYTATFNGIFSVIQLPEGNEVLRLPISGTDVSSEAADRNSKPKEYDYISFKKAINIAINQAREDVMKIFPAIGHVERRTDFQEEEPALFRITFGSNDGVAPGDEVILQRKIYTVNTLTGGKEFSIKHIPLGYIIENGFDDNFCWISVEDKAIASTVKIGEKVLVYNKSLS